MRDKNKAIFVERLGVVFRKNKRWFVFGATQHSTIDTTLGIVLVISFPWRLLCFTTFFFLCGFFFAVSKSICMRHTFSQGFTFVFFFLAKRFTPIFLFSLFHCLSLTGYLHVKQSQWYFKTQLYESSPRFFCLFFIFIKQFSKCQTLKAVIILQFLEVFQMIETGYP